MTKFNTLIESVLKEDPINESQKDLLRESFFRSLKLPKFKEFLKLPKMLTIAYQIIKCLIWDNFFGVFKAIAAIAFVDGMPKILKAEAESNLSYFNVELLVKFNKEFDSPKAAQNALSKAITLKRVSLVVKAIDNKSANVTFKLKLIGMNDCGNLIDGNMKT